MRITNSIIMRGYNRNLNRIGTLKNDTMNKIASTRSFNRASESPLSAAKALNVRKSLYFTEQYQENLEVADDFYTEAETSLLQVSDQLSSIRETLVAACNTTNSTTELNIYALQLEKLAEELCSIFNTNTAGRAIFGGESDSAQPFTIETDADGNASTVLYHGVPVNAMDDADAFPYSDPIYADIGLGIVIDQTTQEIDPQSALQISFNGAAVSDCGADGGVADIDLSSIQEGRNYSITVYADSVKKTIDFTGAATDEENIANIQALLNTAYKKSDETPIIDEQGVIYLESGGIVCAVNNTNTSTRTQTLSIDNDSGYTGKYKLDVESLTPGGEYTITVTIGDYTRDVTFTAGDEADADEADKTSLENLQTALTAAFSDTGYEPHVSTNEITKGVITCEGESVKVLTENTIDSSFLSGTDTIDASGLQSGTTYSFTLYVGGNQKKLSYTATGDADEDQAAMEKLVTDQLDSWGLEYTVTDGQVSLTQQTATISSTDSVINGNTLDMDNITDGDTYTITISIGNETKNVSFIGVNDADASDEENKAATVANLNAALKLAFKNTPYSAEYSYVDDGTGAYTDNGISVSTESLLMYSTTNSSAENDTPVERQTYYSNNYIQLTLDAAKALRNGDIDYANGCIDRIVNSTEKVLLEIANLGCNEEFIAFSIDRLTTRTYNETERQDELESVDLEEMATLYKTYTAIYNASLQMASEVVPNSIFNYMS